VTDPQQLGKYHASPHMNDSTSMIVLCLFALGVSACEPTGSFGQYDPTDDGTAISGSESATAVTEGVGTMDPSSSDAMLCPDSPDGACLDDSCSFSCGGSFSDFDADGCLRPRCETDRQCPEGRSCVVFSDYGQCGASSASCFLDAEADNGCSCGVAGDCNRNVAICVPEAELPPPVELCNPTLFSKEEVFAFEPPLGELSVTADCTITAIVPLAMTCTGGFEGNYMLSLLGDASPALATGQTVTVEYVVEARSQWLNRWLRITTRSVPSVPSVPNVPNMPNVPIIAVQAEDLTPPGLNETEVWLPNLELEIGEVGCERFYCESFAVSGDPRETMTGVSIVASGRDFPSGSAGPISGESGSGASIITVAQARRGGACEESTLDQRSWFAFTLVTS